jgi:glycosyltransferase involved in cell wall biosynthesis
MTKNHQLLSIVVPVARLNGNVTNLQSWISQLPRDDVSVVIVHDLQDELTSQDLHEMLKAAAKVNVRMFEATFNSPGLARNFGMKKSSAEWIWFVDADDFPEVDQAIKMIREAKADSEVLVGDYRVDRLGNRVIHSTSQERNPIMEVAYSPGIWRMVFKRLSLGELNFSHFKMAEDQLFVLQYGFSNRNVQFSNRIIYNYFTNVQGQLTSQVDAISEISKVVPESFKVFQRSSGGAQKFAAIMLVRQVITGWKNSNTKDIFKFLKTGIKSLTRMSPTRWFGLFLATLKVISMKAQRNVR